MNGTFRLIHADVMEGLRQLPDESVQCVVTSPPYWGLRDYGIQPSVWGGDTDCDHQWLTEHVYQEMRRGINLAESVVSTRGGGKKIAAVPDVHIERSTCTRCHAWLGCFGLEPTYQMYVDHAVTIFAEVWRVLRRDGTLWLNLGDCYATDAGNTDSFDPKARGRRRNKRPATNGRGEPQGTEESAIPVTQPNRTTQRGLKPKDLVGIPWRVVFALQEWGWWLRKDIVWSKPNPMPESVRDRPSTSHEYLFLLAKSARYFYDAEAIRETTTGNTHARGGGVNPKARAKTPAGWNTDEGRHDVTPVGRYLTPNAPDKIKSPHGQGFTRRAAGPNSRENVDRVPRSRKLKQNESFSAAVKDVVFSRNARSVWTIATQPFPEAHFATFPEEIPRRCILAGTSPRACGVCGSAWIRIVSVDYSNPGNRTSNGPRSSERAHDEFGTAGFNERLERVATTVGWRPTCDHNDESARCAVLDPFNGSARTGVAAIAAGRDYVGIDRSHEYIEMSRRHLENLSPMFAKEVVG